jgi:hypothetical protein
MMCRPPDYLFLQLTIPPGGQKKRDSSPRLYYYLRTPNGDWSYDTAESDEPESTSLSSVVQSRTQYLGRPSRFRYTMLQRQRCLTSSAPRSILNSFLILLRHGLREGKFCTRLILLSYRTSSISYLQSHAFESCRCLLSRRHLITFTERLPQMSPSSIH